MQLQQNISKVSCWGLKNKNKKERGTQKGGGGRGGEKGEQFSNWPLSLRENSGTFISKSII